MSFCNFEISIIGMVLLSSLITISVIILNALLINYIECTVDINAAELQYLADHLLPEECRTLVAAAHVKTYQKPNTLDQAERKVPDEVPCFELLLHWNKARGEGKGESHTFLEHRLRQIDRADLADWLGKTVFKELGKDLNDTMNEGLKEFADDNQTTEDFQDLRTVEYEDKEDPTEWTPFDSICYTLIMVIITTIIVLCFKLCYDKVKSKSRSRKTQVTMYQKIEDVSDVSESDFESEDKFDIRTSAASSDKYGNYKDKK